MGRFSLLVVVLAACGDNLSVDEEFDPPHFGGPRDPITEQPRYEPQVCGVRTWDLAIEANINVAVAQQPHGATMLALTGESLMGYVFDGRMNLAASGKIAITGTFTGVSASYVGGHIAATTVGGGSVNLHQLDNSLGNPQFIVSVPGTHVAKPAFYETANDIVMPVVGDDGLWLHRYYDSLEPIDSFHALDTKPARSIAAAQMGNGMLTAWSTDYECYMMMTSSFEPLAGPHKMINATCAQPRIAVNMQTQSAVMVFDSDDGVRMMNIQGSQFGGDAPLLRYATRAPRAVFDGTHFWVSYLDERGDIVVGILDENRKPITTSLAPSPQPGLDAYELTIIDGQPWVITLDTTGYTAHHMCAVAEGTDGDLSRSDFRRVSLDNFAL